MSKHRYKEITAKNATRPNGCVLEHRAVAEKMLGRELSGHEVVHHIDGDTLNNSPDNLMVFASLADHSRFHGGAEAKKVGDVYVCVLNLVACAICGKPTTNKKYCSVRCANIGQRKVKRPSKDELRALIEEHSFLALGRMYGVSDNAVRKWARRYELI